MGEPPRPVQPVLEEVLRPVQSVLEEVLRPLAERGLRGLGGTAAPPAAPSGGFTFGSFSEGSLAIVPFGSVSFA